MRIGITGTPGVGKTSVAKELGRRLRHGVLNEREFSLREGIGEFDTEENELVVPPERLGERLGKLLEREKNIIIEGHLICEIRAEFDVLVLLRCNPELLEARLEAKGYKAEKVQDNVFCEGIDYCKKHALRNYPLEKVLEARSRKSIKETADTIVTEIKKKGLA